MSYGKVTIGYGSSEQRDLNVVDFVRSDYPGDRTVHIAKIEDGSYSVTIENLQSSGRSPQQCMRLGEESLIALMAGLQMYFGVKGINPVKRLEEIMEGKSLSYSCSDNLDPNFKI